MSLHGQSPPQSRAITGLSAQVVVPRILCCAQETAAGQIRAKPEDTCTTCSSISLTACGQVLGVPEFSACLGQGGPLAGTGTLRPSHPLPQCLPMLPGAEGLSSHCLTPEAEDTFLAAKLRSSGDPCESPAWVSQAPDHLGCIPPEISELPMGNRRTGKGCKQSAF